MLSFDFDYYKPATLREAIDIYQYESQLNKQPIFISGGTELITLGRLNIVYTNAVIDLKGIVEGKEMGFSGEYLALGSTLTLSQIEEANFFPLLTKTSSGIADHTARRKITLGGNICAQIFYREAVLPFLLADSQVVIFGSEGLRILPINEIFMEQLLLNKGEFLVQLATEKRFIEAPFYTVKRRQQWDTGYPLITVAALRIDNHVRVALSGLCPFPFRSKQVEAALNQRNFSKEGRVEQALSVLPTPILTDIEGSKEYRLFVLQNVLLDALDALT
ncbi:MAG TPA: FAD binding domain-containing protein [Neobacillus sp.]|jgi:CO/xanthine dehydrogenase FAD-binding subunit